MTTHYNPRGLWSTFLMRNFWCTCILFFKQKRREKREMKLEISFLLKFWLIKKTRDSVDLVCTSSVLPPVLKQLLHHIASREMKLEISLLLKFWLVKFVEPGHWNKIEKWKERQCQETSPQEDDCMTTL